MNLTAVVKMIPAEYRDQILDSNAIYKAIAIPNDPHMFMLFTVWVNFVNQGGGQDLTCNKCLGEILGYYRTLQPAMVASRQQDQLLEL